MGFIHKCYDAALIVLFMAAVMCSPSLADTAGRLLVSSHNTHEVFRYDESSGAFLNVMVSTGSGGLNAPHGLAFGPDRNLYVGSAASDAVLRYDGETGAFMDAFVTNGAGGLNYPAGIVFGPDGHLYVASQQSHQILRYHGLTGAFMGAFVAAGSGGINGPSVPVFGPDSNLYVTGRFDHRVYQYNGTNGAFQAVFVTNMLSQPFGIAFGPDQHLYVASGNDNVIRRYERQTGAYIDDFAGAGLNLPVQFIFGPDSNIYACSFGNTTVQRFDGTNGSSLGTFVSSGNGLSGPNFLVFRPEGSGPLDRDHDRMPDYWEITHATAGLSPSISNAATADFDGDFVFNVDEFIADTDPADSNDNFRVINVSVDAGEAVSFRASTSRIYTVQVRSPDSPWTNVEGAIEIYGTGTIHTVTSLSTSGVYQFYRANAVLP